MDQEGALYTHVGLIGKALRIMLPKRRDYSGDQDPFANFRAATVLGLTPVQGALLRMLDKISRVARLSEKQSFTGEVGENILDTLADIVNYAAITAGLIIEEALESETSSQSIVTSGFLNLLVEGQSIHDTLIEMGIPLANNAHLSTPDDSTILWTWTDQAKLGVVLLLAIKFSEEKYSPDYLNHHEPLAEIVEQLRELYNQASIYNY